MENIIVGIGASAGGLEALRTFIGALQPTGRLVYIVAQHLSPSHDSMLTKILSEESQLPVTEASHGVRLKPDTIYVAPPDRDICLRGKDTLTVEKTSDVRPPHPNIDHFFSTLADVKKAHSVGVILSGTGSDGTFGFKCIKKFGGVTVAQDDVSAKYNSMPHSAVSAGVADTVCAPQDMFGVICRLTGVPMMGDPEPMVITDEVVGEIIHELAKETQLDVSQYKPGTIYRRLHMRIQSVQAKSAKDYLTLLRSDPQEMENLRDALLISVTSFFRDPASWDALGDQLEDYLDLQGSPSSFRAWVPGCATGEEAYTLGMLLLEKLGPDADRIVVQIFATDLDGAAIETARAGLYTAEALAGVPPALVDKYFVQERDRYRVVKSLRERCVFARHDLVRSPPFMHIDTITCRNVLIYFDENLQETAFKIFHAALRRGGLLMLGKSEAATRAKDLFKEIDRKHRVYTARDVAVQRPPLKFGEGIMRTTERRRGAKPYEEKPADLLNRLVSGIYAPPSALLDDNFTVLATSGEVSKYLHFMPGEATMDAVALVPKQVSARIRALLHKALTNQVRCSSRFRNVPEWSKHDILVEAIPQSGETHVPPRLVLAFSEKKNDPKRKPSARDNDTIEMAAAERAQIFELERDLALTQEHLQTVVEELEISNEELQTMNEELQSTNEELQASNEQLETSNEELQSSNEELVTVNDELERKSDALVAALGEHEAILETFGSPVFLLDARRALIRCNTESYLVMEGGADNIGRYFDEIVFRMAMPDIAGMIAKAHKSGDSPYDMLVSPDGRHLLVRVKYIAATAPLGAAYLVVFQDQTEVIQAQDELRRSQKLLRSSNERQASIINGLAAHIALVDHEGVIIQVNEQWRRFGELNGYNGADFGVGRSYLNLCEDATGECSEEAVYLARGLRKVLAGDSNFYSMEYPCHAPNEKRWFECIINATSMGSERGAAIMHVDITQKKMTEIALKEALRKAEEAEHAKTAFIATMSHELRTPLNAIIGYAELLQLSELNTTQRDQSEIIIRSGRALSGLIEDILELSSNEFLADNHEMTGIDVRAMLADAREFMLPKAVEHNNTISVDTGEDLPEILFSDARRLRQVLLALLGNALKFTENGSIQLKAYRTKGPVEEAVWVTFEVSDDGIGVAKQDQERIFEPFVQVSSHLARKQGGAGLGLHICRKFVDQMGGELRVESAPGKGSTFYFELPMFAPDTMASRIDVQEAMAEIRAINTRSQPAQLV